MPKFQLRHRQKFTAIGVLAALSWLIVPAVTTGAEPAATSQDPRNPAAAIPENAERVPVVPVPGSPAPGTPPKPSVPNIPAPPPEDGDMPSSLTVRALRDEIKRSPAEQARMSLRSERENLVENQAAIAAARVELRKDTARLEDLRRRVLAAQGGIGESAAGDPVAAARSKAKSPLELLARAMRGMRAEQAAPIVSRLTRPLAGDLISRMPSADAGKVMGQMNPEVAAEITAEIASREPQGDSKP